MIEGMIVAVLRMAVNEVEATTDAMVVVFRKGWK
jgi:hypothetical protein